MLKIFRPGSSEPTDAEQQYSNILKRRLPLWQRPADIKDRKLREEIERLRFYNVKTNAYQFVKEQGIACPQFTEYPSVEAALAANQANKFVLKPAAGHSSKGVYLLQRQADGSLHCQMQQKRFQDHAELAKHYKTELSKAEKFAMSKEVIIEEYLSDAQGFDVPLDYKVYTFYSGATMVMQKHGPTHVPKDEWIFEFYDAKGKSLGNIREQSGSQSGLKLTPPPRFEELITTANKLVKAMSVSFLRIDLYMTPQGVYFGEFTPLPNLGKKAFYDEQELILGKHWQQSLKELGLSYPKIIAD